MMSAKSLVLLILLGSILLVKVVVCDDSVLSQVGGYLVIGK